MAILDLVVFGVILILTVVYLTYLIIGFYGVLRTGWLAVVLLLIYDAFAGLLLVWFILFNPLLTVSAIVYFSVFVAPLNVIAVFGMIARHYLKRMCNDPYCYYPEGKRNGRGRMETTAEKKKCKAIPRDGQYLPHTIDRISTKPYCKYIGITFKPEK